VQAEAFDYPTALFEKRTWRVPRNRPDGGSAPRPPSGSPPAKRPMIVAGGGVLYSEATDALRALSTPPASRGRDAWRARAASRYDHPLATRRDGRHRHLGRQPHRRDADLVIGIGTRYSDFTTRQQDAVPTPRALHQHQRGRVRRLTNTPRCRSSATRAPRWTSSTLRRWATGGCPTPIAAIAVHLRAAWEAEVDAHRMPRGGR
jgi:hypothetical protein